MIEKTFHCAVDPGAGGGLAWGVPGTVRACKMPASDAELLSRAREIREQVQQSSRFLVSIEKVGGYIKPPRIRRISGPDDLPEEIKIEGGQPGSAMFKFGENAGLVRGIFLALGADVELIEPKKWQSPLFLEKGDTEKPEWKRILKRAAQARFPEIKVTLNTADALLILAYKCPELARRGLSVPPTAEKRNGGHPGRNTPPIYDSTPDNWPTGYYAVSRHDTTAKGDLVWNKDEMKWEPVYAINEFVCEYIAVCRPESNDGRGLFCLKEWKGKLFVCRRKQGREILLRPATAEDIHGLPKL